MVALAMWFGWQGLLALSLGGPGAPVKEEPAPSADEVRVEILEGVPDKKSWDLGDVEPAE